MFYLLAFLLWVPEIHAQSGGMPYRGNSRVPAYIMVELEESCKLVKSDTAFSLDTRVVDDGVIARSVELNKKSLMSLLEETEKLDRKIESIGMWLGETAKEENKFKQWVTTADGVKAEKRRVETERTIRRLGSRRSVKAVNGDWSVAAGLGAYWLNHELKKNEDKEISIGGTHQLRPKNGGADYFISHVGVKRELRESEEKTIYERSEVTNGRSGSYYSLFSWHYINYLIDSRDGKVVSRRSQLGLYPGGFAVLWFFMSEKLSDHQKVCEAFQTDPRSLRLMRGEAQIRDLEKFYQNILPLLFASDFNRGFWEPDKNKLYMLYGLN